MSDQRLITDPNEKVLIYAGDGRCYWKQDHCGYTSALYAGVFTRKEAEDITSHAGPEKKVEFHPVPVDHIPTLHAKAEGYRRLFNDARAEIHIAKAERDALAGVVVDLRGALERFTSNPDSSVDEHRFNVLEAERVLAIPLPADAANVADSREKAELLDYYAAHPGCVQFIGPEDGGPRRYCYQADGRFHSRSKDGEPLDFLSALRAARGAV